MSTARDLATTPGLSQIADVLAAGGDRLADLLERAEGRLGRVAEGYGPALEGHVSGTLAAGGKRLRPMLVYISAGESASDDLVAADVDRIADPYDPSGGGDRPRAADDRGRLARR